jgi:hypothetical protein
MAVVVTMLSFPAESALPPPEAEPTVPVPSEEPFGTAGSFEPEHPQASAIMSAIPLSAAKRAVDVNGPVL